MNRFKEISNTEILDTNTGLLWHKYPSQTSFTWYEAKEHVKKLGDGWRLPTVQELVSLLDYNECCPALLKSHPFGSVQSSCYCSGTSCSNSTDYAWYVYLNNGNVNNNVKTNDYYVWPVRGKLISNED